MIKNLNIMEDEAYRQLLMRGTGVAAHYIQDYFDKIGVKEPEFCWYQNMYQFPAFQQLCFSYKFNIYSVIVTFRINGKVVKFYRDINNQLNECEKNNMIPCTITLDANTMKLDTDGDVLLTSTKTHDAIIFSDKKERTLKSRWEISNFGVYTVLGQMMKEGLNTVFSVSDLPGIEPNIWFMNDKGKESYIIVNTITGNFPEKASYKFNKTLLMNLNKFFGYYAEVYIASVETVSYDKNGEIIPLSKRFGKNNPCDLLYRDTLCYIDYKGLQSVELAAAEKGVYERKLFEIPIP